MVHAGWKLQSGRSGGASGGGRLRSGKSLGVWGVRGGMVGDMGCSDDPRVRSGGRAVDGWSVRVEEVMGEKGTAGG